MTFFDAETMIEGLGYTIVKNDTHFDSHVGKTYSMNCYRNIDFYIIDLQIDFRPETKNKEYQITTYLRKMDKKAIGCLELSTITEEEFTSKRIEQSIKDIEEFVKNHKFGIQIGELRFMTEDYKPETTYMN